MHKASFLKTFFFFENSIKERSSWRKWTNGAPRGSKGNGSSGRDARYFQNQFEFLHDLFPSAEIGLFGNKKHLSKNIQEIFHVHWCYSMSSPRLGQCFSLYAFWTSCFFGASFVRFPRQLERFGKRRFRHLFCENKIFLIFENILKNSRKRFLPSSTFLICLQTSLKSRAIHSEMSRAPPQRSDSRSSSPYFTLSANALRQKRFYHFWFLL